MSYKEAYVRSLVNAFTQPYLPVASANGINQNSKGSEESRHDREVRLT